jgi:hypothetical protein
MELIRDAKPFWRARRKWFKEFQQIAYEMMFDNSAAWYPKVYGGELTKKKFMELLGMPCLVTFYRTDDDVGVNLSGWSDELFGDHGIDVYGTLSGGLQSQ